MKEKSKGDRDLSSLDVSWESATRRDGCSGSYIDSAVGDFLFAGLIVALCSVSGPPSTPGLSPLLSILFYSPLLLSFTSFILSIGIFNGQNSRGTYPQFSG